MRRRFGNFKLKEFVFWSIVISVVLVILTILISLLHISARTEKKHRNQSLYELQNSERQYLRQHALTILNLVQIAMEKKEIEERERIRHEARKLNILINSIYKKNRNKSNSALKKHISSIINDLSNELSDYFFIYDFRSRDFLVPDLKITEKKNAVYRKSMEEIYNIFTQSIYSQNETLIEYRMIRSHGEDFVFLNTTAYVFYFKPLDILIGANSFPNKTSEYVRNNFKNRIRIFEKHKKIKVFTGNYSGELFTDYAGEDRDIELKDENGKSYGGEFLRAALKGGDFIEYNVKKEGAVKERIVNYVVGIDEWSMFFCCQISLSEDTKASDISYTDILTDNLLTFLILFTIITSVSIFLGVKFNKEFSGDIRNISKWVDNYSAESQNENPEFNYIDVESLFLLIQNRYSRDADSMKSTFKENRFLKSIIDQAQVGIQIWSRNKRNSIKIEYTNKYYSNLMDVLTKSKFTKRRTGILRSTVHKCLISVRSVFDSPHEKIENEVLIDDINDKELNLRISAAPIFDENGDFAACVEIVTDLTEKYETINRLKVSERNYKEIFNTSTDSIIIFEPSEFKIVDVNNAMQKLFGYSYEEALRLSYLDLSYDHSKVRIIQYRNLFASIREKSPLFFIWRGKKKNGSSISMENVLKRVNIDDKEHILLFSKDITIQKEAQEELERTKSYLDNIVNSMPSALIGADMDGKVIEANNRAMELGTDQKVIGKHILVAFPWLEDYLDLVFGSIKEKQPKTKLKQALHIHNKKMYFNITCYPLPSEFENQAVIQLDNITDQVRIEEMIVHSEKMMTVGGLAAGMAHEINNPLGIIMQAAENTFRRLSPDFEKNKVLAEKYHIDLESVWEYLKERQVLDFMFSIRDATNRASDIVKNMLNFSRMKTERKENLDINSIIDDTIYLAMHDYDLKKQYDFKSIKLVKDLGDALPEVNVSKTEIEQVILNLLKNAAHAMINRQSEDDPEIRIRSFKEDNYLKISIIDNGKGMTENVQKRIFEPFYTTKPVGSGTGLGLSVSYFIVSNNHNGKLEVDSKPGKGARFTISLPI